MLIRSRQFTIVKCVCECVSMHASKCCAEEPAMTRLVDSVATKKFTRVFFTPALILSGRGRLFIAFHTRFWHSNSYPYTRARHFQYGEYDFVFREQKMNK